MNKILVIALVSLIFATSVFAEVGFEGRPITNNLWTATGHTLNKGEFLVGIGPIGLGITDNVQIGTNILLFLFQIYNANLKVNLVKSPTMALAAGIDYSRFSLSRLLQLGDEEMAFNTISPYIAVSANIGTNTILHFGGKYSIIDEDIEDFEAESSTTGTELLAGIEYSMSYKTKLLADVGYDITFEGFRAGGGVLFGWEKFRLKLGVGYYAPESADKAYTLPVVGLWWRFKG